MSIELDDTVRWEVHVGKGSGAYRTRYSFTRFYQAVCHYNSINVHSGYKKRLVHVHANGSRYVTARVIT